jgi:WD40 repeat protein
LRLKPILWEDMPLQADMSFQEGIDLLLSKDNGIDIAVFLLWSRLGSPLGPRVRKQDGSEYLSGTERELDLMLEARRLNGGERPSVLIYCRQDEIRFEERLRGLSTSEKQEVISQKRLVESFMEERFHDSERGFNVGAFHSFDQPTSFSKQLRKHLIEILNGYVSQSQELTWDIDTAGAPYLGLEAFGPEHARVFFGREEDILEGRMLLRENARSGAAFLLVSGASGSGKSSLARAGLLPDIASFEVDEVVSKWLTAIVTPKELGMDPIEGLLRVISAPQVLPELRSDSDSISAIAKDLRTDPVLTVRYVLRDAFSRSTLRHKMGVRLLLVIDQLEEVFTLRNFTTEEREIFFTVLESLCRSGNVWVIATTRSDFLHRLQESSSFGKLLLGKGLLSVTSPTADELRRIIEEPALASGLQFETKGDVSLAGKILTDATTHAELLPLIEFLLRELFENRSSDGLLSYSQYERLGGVRGAIEKQAEAAFSALSKEGQDVFEEMLSELIAVDGTDGIIAVRRSSPMSAWSSSSAKREVAESLIQSRLLKTEMQGETAVIAFTHESLLQHWSRVRHWIDRHRDLLAIRSRLERNFQLWEQRARDRTLLLAPGFSLNEAKRLASQHPKLLSADIHRYIQASIDKQELEKRRKWKAIAGVASIFLILLALMGFAFWNSSVSYKTAKVQAYIGNLRLAQLEIKQGNLIAATQQLESIDANQRGWEWNYLNSLAGGAEFVFKDSRERITDLAFSPQADRVAIASFDGFVRVYELSYGKLICSFGGHKSLLSGKYVDSLAFSNDGKLIVSAGVHERIIVWNAETAEVVCEMRWPNQLPDRFVNSVHFGRDENVIVSTSEKRASFHVQSVDDLRETISIQYWRLPEGELIKEQTFPTDKRDELTKLVRESVLKDEDSSEAPDHFSRNQLEALDVAIHLSKYETAPEVGEIDLDRWVVSKSGFFAAGYNDGLVRVWRTKVPNAVQTVWKLEQSIEAVQFSPDGRKMAVVSGPYELVIIDVLTGSIDLKKKFDSPLLAFTCNDNPTVTVVCGALPEPNSDWMSKTDICLESASVFDVNVGGDPVVIQKSVAAGTRLRSVLKGKICLPFFTRFEREIGYSDDGTLTAFRGRSVNVGLSLVKEDGSLVHDDFVKSDRCKFYQISFSPKNDLIAAACFILNSSNNEADRVVRLWNVSSGELKNTLIGHAGDVTGVAWNSDETRIFSSGEDKTIRVWSVDGVELLRLEDHSSQVNCIDFDTNQQVLATGDRSGELRVWRQR